MGLCSDLEMFKKRDGKTEYGLSWEGKGAWEQEGPPVKGGYTQGQGGWQWVTGGTRWGMGALRLSCQGGLAGRSAAGPEEAVF